MELGRKKKEGGDQGDMENDMHSKQYKQYFLDQ